MLPKVGREPFYSSFLRASLEKLTLTLSFIYRSFQAFNYLVWWPPSKQPSSLASTSNWQKPARHSYYLLDLVGLSTKIPTWTGRRGVPPLTVLHTFQLNNFSLRFSSLEQGLAF